MRGLMSSSPSRRRAGVVPCRDCGRVPGRGGRHLREETMTERNRVPVFIVGGGPVGLALALALDRFGIRSLVVERSPTTTDHPKSRGCWVRTMEIFRQWGVEDAIRARGLADGTDVFVMMERLTGREYGRTRSEPRGDQSPTWKSLVAQDAVEEE